MMLTSLPRRRPAISDAPQGNAFFFSGPCNTCHTFALAALGALLLAACAGEPEAEAVAGQKVECAIGGAADFAPDCTMELHEGEDGRSAILRHPDGGFRRFQLGVPGQGLITADGMEPAEVVTGEGMVEVRVGSDRYRLPVAQ